MAPLGLAACVDEAVRLVRLSRAGKEINFVNHCDPAIVIEGDRSRLVQVFVNLLTNACDASQPGSTVDITAAPDEADESVRIVVRDQGTGIPEELQERVFEPFFTTKDVGKGSGLGLSMVYGFVKQSDGHISITSAPNQGTSVHLYFPRVHASLARVTIDASQADELPRGTELILVVEDNAEVRRTAVDILSTLGYRVIEAANGHEALERFTQHPEIALVFSDVMLPGGMLGSQLIQKLEERRPGLRVLLTSGFSESGIMTRGMLDGSIELLQKPYKVEELARRVRALLDSKEETDRVPT